MFSLFIKWYIMCSVCSFYFNLFNISSNSNFVTVGPSSSGVIFPSLSNSSSSSESLYNSSIYCCHLSAISSSSIRIFPYFYSIIDFFILNFPKKPLLIRLYDFSVFPRLSWVFIFFTVLPKPFFFIFLSLSIYKISKSAIFTFVLIMFLFPSLFY